MTTIYIACRLIFKCMLTLINYYGNSHVVGSVVLTLEGISYLKAGADKSMLSAMRCESQQKTESRQEQEVRLRAAGNG